MPRKRKEPTDATPAEEDSTDDDEVTDEDQQEEEEEDDDEDVAGPSNKKKAKSSREKKPSDEVVSVSDFVRPRNFMELPRHILAQIFQELSPIEKIGIEGVCQRWGIVAKHSSWTKTRCIDFFDFDENPGLDDIISNLENDKQRIKTNTKKIKAILERCGKYLIHLMLDHFRSSVAGTSLCRIISDNCGKKNSNLTVLSLIGISMTNTGFVLLGRGCPNLKAINLQNTFKMEDLENGLASFLQKATQLEELVLKENDLHGGRSFRHLPTTLKILDLTGCVRVHFNFISYIRSRCPDLKILRMVITSAPAIRELDKMLVGWGLRSLQLDNYEGANIGRLKNIHLLKELQELKLCDCNFFRGEDLNNLCEARPPLKKLFMDLSRIGQIDEVIWKKLANFTELQKINFSHSAVSDTILKHMAIHCKKLMNVVLRFCNEVTGKTVLELIKQCPDLQQISLRGCVKMYDEFTAEKEFYAALMQAAVERAETYPEAKQVDMQLDLRTRNDFPKHSLLKLNESFSLHYRCVVPTVQQEISWLETPCREPEINLKRYCDLIDMLNGADRHLTSLQEMLSPIGVQVGT